MVAVMKLKAMFHANSTSWNFEAKVTEADYLWRDDHRTVADCGKRQLKLRLGEQVTKAFPKGQHQSLSKTPLQIHVSKCAC